MAPQSRLAALRRFHGRWAEQLGATVRFEFACGEIPSHVPPKMTKADAFVVERGFSAIGFNWELLDPSSDHDAPRSAFATIVEALSHDLSQPSKDWLDPSSAGQCASEFLGAFDSGTLSIVTNHLNGLWWPISDARDEWTFVAMDDAVIAMMVLAG